MSNIVYHRKGSTLRDAFIYQNGDGTFNTGRVQGDFTIRLSQDGTGNQSTTGVSITEVSAANNPGEYEVEVASSAFVAANGTYTLIITRTSDTTYTWEQVYVVNDTGTSTSTPASFTATASDGRITDGVNPIEDADVYITLGSTFITQTTTDASGLWGPIYLPSDGTYTIRAQSNGYTQGTGSIIASGASVTGPGADIALTAGSTVDPMSAAQLWAYARRMAVDLTGTKADAIIKGAVNDALDMVSSERLWPHLLRRYMLPLKGAYSTGTISISGTNITLVGGTWPSWAASGKIQVSGQILEISARTSDSVVTLAQTYEGQTVTSQSYILYQNEYVLPDDMWKFHHPLPGQRWGWGGNESSPIEVMEAENAAIYGQQFPSVFCCANGMFMCFPYPNQDAMLAFTYYARPARLTSDTDVADLDPVHLELLKRAIDYQLSRQLGKVTAGDAATTLGAYKEVFARFADMDKTPTEIDPVGNDWNITGSHRFDWKRRT